jgi:HJR/Mrr/RecB family endonuclease
MSEDYKKLEYRWRDFKNLVSRLRKEIDEVVYDGAPVLISFLDEAKANAYFSGPIFDHDSRWEYGYLPKWLYLLPIDLRFLRSDEILTPSAPPIFHGKLPDPPKLEADNYPNWFLDKQPMSWKSGRVMSHKESELEDRQETLKSYKSAALHLRQREMDWSSIYEKRVSNFRRIRELCDNADAKAIGMLISLANKRNFLPKSLRGDFHAVVDIEKQTALIEFEFPDFTNRKIPAEGAGATTRRGSGIKYLTEANKRKLVRLCLYSMAIRAAYIAARVCDRNWYSTVAVNVRSSWFDAATGQARQGIIASLVAPVDQLVLLDLSKLDPDSCFRQLKGLATPSVESLAPIRPIFVLNTEDSRVVETKNVADEMAAEENLAAIPWEEFEHLVAQLFEWEFAQQGMEVKVTRASRDRGVDAILFDPDPLRGGKYVIQAKRYTRVVDVAAVRDLYGTIMNEGANRGILITTSSFGPDSYEFAKDKQISLVDGQNLLVMLRKHGKRFRIDLEEARTQQSQRPAER